MSFLKDVLSLLSMFVLAMLHSSFDVTSHSLNEKVNALLNRKVTLQNEAKPPLPSWTLLPNNATNSSNNQITSSISCSYSDERKNTMCYMLYSCTILILLVLFFNKFFQFYNI